jgi:hypothetical protein
MADAKPLVDTGEPGASGPGAGGAQPRREGLSIAAWFAFVVLAFFFAGPAGAATALILAVWVIVESPSPRALIGVSIVLLLLVPIEVLTRGLPSRLFVSPDFVRKNLLAHYLAGAGLLFLVVGIFRAALAERAATAPPALGGAVGDGAPQPARRPLSEPEPEPAPEPPSRRASVAYPAAIGLLTLGSFVLRCAASGGGHIDPSSDAIAQSLLHGQGYALPGPFGIVGPTALRMPGVPILLTISNIASAAGPVQRLLWAALGAAIVPLCAATARRLFGSAAGVAAALLAAALPSFWLANGRFDNVVLAQLLVSCLLVTIAVGPERVTPLRAAAAGAIAGLLALARPEGVLLAVLMVGVWIAGRHVSALSIRRRGAVAGAALVAFALVFVPWMARGQATFGTPFPTTEVGYVLSGSNASQAYGGGFVGSFSPDAASQAVQRVSNGLPLGEAALDRRLRSDALHYAADHVPKLVPVIGVRVLRTFGLWSPMNERAVHAARGIPTRGWLLAWAGSLLLLALAGIGYWRLRRRISGALAPLYAAPVAVAIAGAATYGEPFMRQVIDPVLVVVAAAALAGVVRGRRNGRASGDGGSAEAVDRPVPREA